MNKSIRLLLLTSLLIVITACGTKESTGESKAPNQATTNHVVFEKDAYQKLVTANNELGFKLVDKIETDEDGNTFVSPTSLFMALSMIYNGADGETKEEIAKVLAVEGIAVADLNQANASLMATLDKESNGIQLNIANSIWLNEDYHFQEGFAQNNKEYFSAAIAEIDIDDDDSVKKINDWVKKSTNNKIEDIVDPPLDPDLVAILINAIYFNGDWTHEFKKEETEQETFNLADGSTKEIPLMTLTKELSYIENADFQALKLPYGDGEMSMHIYLPKETSSLAAFMQTITPENWLAWNAMFEIEEGTIRLPKFELEYEVLLKDSLQKLGMGSAFSKGANFSKMIQENDPIWISKVKQKTFLTVHEEGTEAAAATSIEVVTESAAVNQPFHMEVNRPFFIAIVDEETDLILFTGTIANPKSE